MKISCSYGFHWGWVNIGSCYGLMRSSNKPLPETNFDQNLWCHVQGVLAIVDFSHAELFWIIISRLALAIHQIISLLSCAFIIVENQAIYFFAAGPLLYGPYKVLQQYTLIPCGHDTPLPANRCLHRLAVKQKKRKDKFFFGTQVWYGSSKGKLFFNWLINFDLINDLIDVDLFTVWPVTVLEKLEHFCTI